MIFNSVTFLIFLPVVVILYWLLPRRARLMMIFSSSLFFYGCWRFEYIPIMLMSVFIDYFASRRLEVVDKPAARRLILALSLSANLGLLAYFKYTMFAVENLNSLAGLIGSDTRFSVHAILLPLGISFYTFQSISYTIDVYRRNLDAQRDFLLFANYVVFFPQLIAGPILRASEVMWQLDNRPNFKLENLEAGTRAILAGLFLKVVLADNIAPLVDMGYAHSPEMLGAIDVWTLAFLFGFQIYFDFAAYSQVAIGSARLMGIHFPENFNFPYLACSPKDFWRRWHISLSSWVRDYLYLPLCSVPVDSTSTGGLSRGDSDQKPCIRSPQNDRTLRLLGIDGFVAWACLGLCALGRMACCDGLWIPKRLTPHHYARTAPYSLGLGVHDTPRDVGMDPVSSRRPRGHIDHAWQADPAESVLRHGDGCVWASAERNPPQSRPRNLLCHAPDADPHVRSGGDAPMGISRGARNAVGRVSGARVGLRRDDGRGLHLPETHSPVHLFSVLTDQLPS